MKHLATPFPANRPRRLRRDDFTRRLVRESALSVRRVRRDTSSMSGLPPRTVSISSSSFARRGPSSTARREAISRVAPRVHQTQRIRPAPSRRCDLTQRIAEAASNLAGEVAACLLRDYGPARFQNLAEQHLQAAKSLPHRLPS